jgi:hypothetical protein
VSVAVLEQREVFAERLWRLLPGVYRARDTSGELRAFVGLFADELLRLRAGLDQQLADHFIDSCQDWVIPYLADLVGTTVLHADARRNRIDVKNTIRWRRMKGTLRGLEDVAAGVSGWGSLASEMMTRVVWLQNFAHLQLQARFALDLRDRDAVAALNTPFSRTRSIQDLRPTAQRGGALIGVARARNALVHVWPIASFPLQEITPVGIGGGRFRFSSLGLDQALYAGGDKERLPAGHATADICATHPDHIPLRTRDVGQHAPVYVNTRVGFTLREDGIAICSAGPDTGSVPVPSRTAAIGYAELAQSRGLIAGDETLFGPAHRFPVAAIRMGAVVQTVNSLSAPVLYSPGLPFDQQFTVLNPHGTVQLDGVTPSFAYTPGVAPYEPEGAEFHRPYLLVRITNDGAVTAVFPESELIVRNARGTTLQVFLPAVATLGAGAALHLYVAEDGSTYFARGDHAAGVPDLNPDSGPFGAMALNHLARGAEAQVRIRPGHPLGANRTRRAVIRSLCCWDKPLEPPLAAGQVAIDPERGRFVFAAGEVPLGELSVDYRYGLSHGIGAGPYDRGSLPEASITVARLRDAQHASIQAAIDAAPDGAAVPIVIEILDSATYVETLMIANRNFPGGIVIQASGLATPTLRKAAGPGALLSVSTSTIMRLDLDGLTFVGGDVQVNGAVDAVQLRYCTLVPTDVSLLLGNGTTTFAIDASICGAVQATAPQGTAIVNDSAFQHPSATIEQPQGHLAFGAEAFDVKLERCTVIGDVEATTAFVSNALLYGDVTLADAAASCLRFSRVPPTLHPPRAFRTTSATPIFVSTRYGDAGYLHLHPNSASELLAGGEEGGEIGVFHRAGKPWGLQNLAIRLAEFTPAGVDPYVIAVLPQLSFRGNLPT